MTAYQFDDAFLWGAATAAYQIEGAWNVDGRGESIWDRFSHTPGNVVNGDNGDVACDHYHRYRQDIGLMQQLGLQAYRFSIAWPRVMPRGRGPVNLPGLDFYDRLVDALLEANIQPFLTLHHWDLPQVLYEQGGWLNRETGHVFADFATAVARRLGDRVRSWATFNEPGVIAFDGYLTGEHAPGIRDLRTALQVAHNLMVAHGLATQALRAAAPDLQVGIVLNQWGVDPASNDPADIAAADLAWYSGETTFLEPLFRGYYHPLAVAAAGDNLPHIQDGDMALIAQQLDFLGLNFYSRSLIGAAGTIEPVPGSDYTDMDWEVCPGALTRLLVRMHRDYRLPPIYITENGAAYTDTVSADGSVDDSRRLSYIRDHLIAVHDAIQQGVDVRGYFAWSLLDNFEWAQGYARRFGIIHVDYPTQRRTIKRSGHWYAATIRQRQIDV